MARNASTRCARPKLVHQFLIALTGTDPLVWRRIGGAYDANAFDPRAVVFDDPVKRFKKAFKS